MNAFAKVLVFFVLVLSIGFAVSQMVTYSKRVKVGELYEQVKSEAQSAKGELETTKATLAEATKTYDGSLAGKQTEIDGLKTELESQESEIAELKTEDSRLRDDVNSLAASLKDVKALIEQKEALIARLGEQNKDLAGKLDERLTLINKLDETVAAQKAKVEGLTAALEDLRTDYASLKEEKNEYQTMVTRLSEAGYRLPGEAITGVDAKIVNVDMQYGLVVLNRGDEHGVKVNYPFTVYRDTDYIAQVQVYEVHEKLSLALLKKGSLVEGRQIQVGDDATTRILLPMSLSER